MRTLIVTTASRLNHWRDALHLDKLRLANDHVYVTCIEAGAKACESQMWGLVLLDTGVELPDDMRRCLGVMSHHIARLA